MHNYAQFPPSANHAINTDVHKFYDPRTAIEHTHTHTRTAHALTHSPTPLWRA